MYPEVLRCIYVTHFKTLMCLLLAGVVCVAVAVMVVAAVGVSEHVGSGDRQGVAI